MFYKKMIEKNTAIIITDEIAEYDHKYSNIDDDMYSFQRGIIVESDGRNKSVILLAGGGGIPLFDRSSFVVGNNNENLVVILGDTVFCLSIPELKLLWKQKGDDSYCIGIYQIPGGYIVHGELAITRISLSGTIMWRFYGREIFVTSDGSEHFFMQDDIIVVKDWENSQYKISINGKEVK